MLTTVKVIPNIPVYTVGVGVAVKIVLVDTL